MPPEKRRPAEGGVVRATSSASAHLAGRVRGDRGGRRAERTLNTLTNCDDRFRVRRLEPQPFCFFLHRVERCQALELELQRLVLRLTVLQSFLKSRRLTSEADDF